MSILSPNAQKILAKAYAARNEGNVKESMKLVRPVAKKHADNLHVIYLLGTNYLELGEFKKAKTQFEKGIKLDPNGHMNQSGLGSAYFKMGDYEDARKYLEIAISRNQGDLNYLKPYALTLFRLSENDTALKILQVLHKQMPDDKDICLALIDIYCFKELYEEAHRIYNGYVSSKPNDIEMLENFMSFLADRTNFDYAKEIANKIFEIQPNSINTMFDLFNIASFEGDKKLEREYLTKIFELCNFENVTDKINFYIGCSNTKNLDIVPKDDQERLLSEILSLAEENDKLEQINFNTLYNLSNLLEKHGRFDASFAALKRAASLKRSFFSNGGREFNRSHFTAYVEAIKNFAQWDSLLAKCPQHDDRLVFICAMPRSGTTLMERILDAHPEAEGIGESQNLDRLKTSIKNGYIRFEPQLDWPDVLLESSVERLQSLSNEFLSGAIDDLKNKTVRKIVDKSISNFLHVGLLAVLFPKAQFIYCARNRMAAGLSIYQQNFANKFLFDTDIEDINFMFDVLEDLMSFWSDLLGNRIITIPYEELVQNPEENSKQLIEHTGLDWDPACLDFHKSTKTIKTASRYQARSKVYTSSSERYKAYEKYLLALKS